MLALAMIDNTGVTLNSYQLLPIINLLETLQAASLKLQRHPLANRLYRITASILNTPRIRVDSAPVCFFIPTTEPLRES